MSLNAIGIMLKPLLAKYIDPLEENGTIAKLQADIQLIADSNAIPELGRLVANLELHNQLMQRFFELVQSAESQSNERTETKPGPDTGTTGLVGHDRGGMPSDTIPN